MEKRKERRKKEKQGQWMYDMMKETRYNEGYKRILRGGRNKRCELYGGEGNLMSHIGTVREGEMEELMDGSGKKGTVERVQEIEELRRKARIRSWQGKKERKGIGRTRHDINSINSSQTVRLCALGMAQSPPGVLRANLSDGLACPNVTQCK
ncbi:hypothetical protein EVAR_98517_1 [Eumeta japonica]|uniref:Uncharacterized protein n=1 Tax=Eumeta variegata TaxID=151549 RepID=A0A4C1SUD0_EUMVA|nr:hypothetical protein EVAR_98517_1 [Eumeta japonica]